MGGGVGVRASYIRAFIRGLKRLDWRQGEGGKRKGEGREGLTYLFERGLVEGVQMQAVVLMKAVR